MTTEVARPNRDLIDQHIHVGGAVAPHILWSIAHQQGYKLPTRNYWDFVELVTARGDKVKSLEDYLQILHKVTEKIQSSPAAIERSVYEIIGKEYRGSRVQQIELRFNPMKRNEGGERDLDHIIHAAIRGMDRACLEYGVKACLLFCLAREFDYKTNAIIVEKAIKYRTRGVRGIDLAGTEKNAIELSVDEAPRYRELYAKARAAGLGTTVHTGETRNTNADGVLAVLEHLQPARIGHGIRAAYSEDALGELKRRGTVLEICPSSNLQTRAVEGIIELKHILRTFLDRGVKFTINTDGPYLLDTDMKSEIDLLRRNEVLTDEQLEQCLRWAEESTFIEAT